MQVFNPSQDTTINCGLNPLNVTLNDISSSQTNLPLIDDYNQSPTEVNVIDDYNQSQDDVSLSLTDDYFPSQDDAI